MGKAEQVILGRRMAAEHEPQSGPVEGEVFAISASGITFTIRAWDSGKHLFGPAPYTWPRHTTLTDNGTLGSSPHTHTVPLPSDGPAKGDRCLVVFGDNGPWVIGWWPK